MRLDDLATRLVAVEAKLATLTGTTVNTNAPTTTEELDARLSVVEAQVDHLIAVKTAEHIDVIVSAPADAAPVAVEDVVALSPSADVPEAAAIVADVVADQHEADAIADPEVAAVIAAAIVAIITAEPEVVTDPVAIAEVIAAAVADAPAPSTPEAVEAAVAAVADIIATATGVGEVAPEVVAAVLEAVSTPADPALDAIEARISTVETKVDSLLGN